MAGVNKAIIIGNLGGDPEIRHLSTGAAVANINVATTETYKDKQTGERREQTEWHRVVLWRGLADIAEKYLRKGSKVYIEGKLRTRSWEDQGGQKRYTTEIHADNMTMLDRANSGEQGSSTQYSPPATSNSPTSQSSPVVNTPQGAPADEMDDLPF